MALPGKWTIKDLIALTYIKGLTYPSIKKIIQNYKSLKSLLENKNPDVFANNIRQNQIFVNSLEEAYNLAQQQLEISEENQVFHVSYWDDEYPALLKEITGAPILLYVKGNLQPPESTSISIVGTRKNSLYGKLSAEKFAEFFAINSVIVTSGLAYGIDSIAHQSAIKSKGITYAIIASGIDCIASGNGSADKISKKILDSGGAILSEYKCGTRALPSYFPQRNRIISGISIATLIVESGIKGGALITGRFAFDQQREVFAVPGNINSEKSQGTNMLIRTSQATIAVSPEDVFKTLGFTALNFNYGIGSLEEQQVYTDSPIFNYLSFDPIHVDELSEKARIEMPELLVKLLEYEFKGLVRQLPGKYYIRN